MTVSDEARVMQPCPFCKRREMKYGCPQRAPWHTNVPEHFNVHCECGAVGPDAPTSAEAIAVWNTRALSQRPSPHDEGVALVRAARDRVRARYTGDRRSDDDQ